MLFVERVQGPAWGQLHKTRCQSVVHWFVDNSFKASRSALWILLYLDDSVEPVGDILRVVFKVKTATCLIIKDFVLQLNCMLKYLKFERRNKQCRDRIVIHIFHHCRFL